MLFIDYDNSMWRRRDTTRKIKSEDAVKLIDDAKDEPIDKELITTIEESPDLLLDETKDNKKTLNQDEIDMEIEDIDLDVLNEMD